MSNRHSPAATTPPEPAAARIEWQTCALIVAVYGAWFAAVAFADRLGPWLANAALIVLTCWFMSLQHELLHGHPTRWRAVNRLFGLAPLAVWYPYDIYRAGHLAHHRDEMLTEPGIDPESNYIAAADFDKLHPALRPLWFAQRTVLGRVLLGPAMVILPTWLDIVRRPMRGDLQQAPTWALHLSLLAALLWALDHYAGIGPLRYMMAIAYPALGLAMLRSFFEHRPAALPAHRVVINEAAVFWRLLYLNNNYHSVHHESPSLPWYAIRRRYRAERAGVLARNGGFLVEGYGSLLWRHAWKPIDSPVHTPMA